MKSLWLKQYQAILRWHEIGGTGATIVALPGMSFPAVSNFLETATQPDVSHNRWIMVDYIGSGCSDHAARFPAKLSDHSACIAALMDHLGIRDCVVIGYSMGGTVAIDLAFARPDLVANLILAECNVLPGGGTASARIAAKSEADFVNSGYARLMTRLRQAPFDPAAFESFILAAWQGVDPVSLHRNAKALVDLPGDFFERFLALTCPRTFVYGGENFPAPGAPPTPDLPDPEALRAAGVAVEILAGTGHALMLKNPAGFAAILRRALA